MSMNALPDLVLTVERARTYKEATDANADRDFSGNTARQVHISAALNSSLSGALTIFCMFKVAYHRQGHDFIRLFDKI